MRAVCTQRLLTAHKVLWGVKSAAPGRAYAEKREVTWTGLLFTPNSRKMMHLPSLPSDQSVKRCLTLWIVKCEMLTFYCTHQANQCISFLKCQNTVPKWFIPPPFIKSEPELNVLGLSMSYFTTLEYSSNFYQWLWGVVHTWALI